MTDIQPQSVARKEQEIATALNLQAAQRIEELRAIRDRLIAVLRACESYFEERADAEYIVTSAGAHGNEEMSLLVEIREELRRAK